MTGIFSLSLDRATIRDPCNAESTLDALSLVNLDLGLLRGSFCEVVKAFRIKTKPDYLAVGKRETISHRVTDRVVTSGTDQLRKVEFQAFHPSQ